MEPVFLASIIIAAFSAGRWSKSWPSEAPEGTERDCWEATLARRNIQ